MMDYTDKISSKMELLSNLTNHGLIKLYLEIKYMIMRPNVSVKNEIIVSYLKSAIKMPRYKLVKSSIRELVNYGKFPQANMEQKLLEVEEIILVTKASMNSKTDLCEFMNILMKLESYCGVIVDNYNSDVSVLDHIYLEPGFLSENFDKYGMLKGKVNLHVSKYNITFLEFALLESGWRLYEDDITLENNHHKVYIARQN